MGTPENSRAKILICHSSGLSDWVKGFEREANTAGCVMRLADEFGGSPGQMRRGILDSELVIAVVDPDSSSNASWVEFVVGAAFALEKTVWLVTPEPPSPGKSVTDWFEELRRAVGSSISGSPGEIAQRLDGFCGRNRRAKAC